MGKNIIVALFLASCGLALVVLFTRSARPRLTEDPEAAKSPRVSLEEFTLYKYRNHKVETTLSGKLAHFLDPNILELYGSLRGLRHNTEKREYLSAESAIVYFSSNGISQLMENAEIIEAELEDNVNLGIKYNRLLTEFAEYLPNEKLLQSELPVVLKGPTGEFEGQNGFRYFMDDENIRIFGPIKGTLQGTTMPAAN